MATESKPIYASKINWVQAVMVAVALVSDPNLHALNILPVRHLPTIMWVCSALTFILRTFFSGERLTFRSRSAEGE